MNTFASCTRRLALAALTCGGCNLLLGLEDGTLATDRCEPYTVAPCYTGPQATRKVGACHDGLRQCSADGYGVGVCEGEQTPMPERCGNAVDDDCDGGVDEADLEDGSPAGDGCACKPDAARPCYTGPLKTEGVGACHTGSQTCSPQGHWGTCLGEATPKPEDCATAADDDCDGSESCGVAAAASVLGGPSVQVARALALGPDGGAVLGGEFVGSLDLGDGPLTSDAERDVFVARFGAGGALLWKKRWVGAGRGHLHAAATNASGTIAIVGELEGEMLGTSLVTSRPTVFLLVLSASGDLLCSATITDRPSDLTPPSVAMNRAGEVAVAAAMVDEDRTRDVEVQVSHYLPQPDTCRACQCAPAGTLTFGGRGHQVPTGVGFDEQTDSPKPIVVYGMFEDALTLDERWPSRAAEGRRNLFLLKLDKHAQATAESDLVVFGGAYEGRSGDVVVGSDGTIALSGRFQGILHFDDEHLAISPDTESAFLATLDSSGSRRAIVSFRIGDTNDPPVSAAPRLAVSPSGDLFITGDAARPIDLGGGALPDKDGSVDIYAARFDAAAHHRWSRRFGPVEGARDGDRCVAGIAFDPTHGELVVAGTLTRGVGLGCGASDSSGSDILLLRLLR